MSIASHYLVEHRTNYKYSSPVTLSHQRLHLTPRAVSHQQVKSHEIIVNPQISHRMQANDSFGNPLVEVTIEHGHTELDILARSRVSVLERSWPDPEQTAPWETVRDALLYRANWHPDEDVFDATQYLFESPHVRLKRDLALYLQDCFPPGRSILVGADALMTKIHSDFRFDPLATTVSTPVMTVFKQRRGVCQDFTHLMISCLRSIGLAARYVSGYLVTHASKGEQTLVGADASHAWVSLFVPGSGWVELDPTNNVRPGLQHVVLGWGRDFSDVTPLRGVINAGCEQKLKVSVVVRPE
jgi:transglutaminase-like putative cysteine protease